MTSTSNLANTTLLKKRGRKPNVLPINNDCGKIVLQQHHFNYSDGFANELYNFAVIHLEDTNREFKKAWKEWTEENATQIREEINRMKKEGYPGSVEDKMYFSARYYYRKKAIKNREEEEDDACSEEEEDKPKRKKYECTDKELLTQMNEHIISKIYCLKSCDMVNGTMVSKMTPSKAFLDYCNKYEIPIEDEQVKKTYKNLYWRISKKTSGK
jgi:hypothetical protein